MSDNQEKIDYLRKSLVFNMSLGNKELFHSNMWATLMEKYPEIISIFFDKLKDDNPTITREYRIKDAGNVDICIKTNDDNKYFIENKFKALPNEEQLKKYSGERNLKKGVITGLIKPDFFEDADSCLDIEGVSWTFLSYEQIATKLKKYDSNINKKDKDIFEQYRIMLGYITDLIKDTLKSNENIYNPKIDIEGGEKLRLGDVIKKLHMSKLKKALSKENLNCRDVEFFRGTALMNIKINNNLNFQLQGLQLRLYANKEKDLNDLKLDNFKLNKKICHFGNSFFYKYIKLKENMKFEDLINLIKKCKETIEK